MRRLFTTLISCAIYPVSALNVIPNLVTSSWQRDKPQLERRGSITQIWVPEDTYMGNTFFDGFTFFDFTDPTSGFVQYVNSTVAFEKGLALVNENNQVIMRTDNTTWLPENGFRESVRISSIKSYNSGLFILDLTHAPWGCSVWPAFWTVGPNWPNQGEIDIFEGVHINRQNQITWHTGNNCNLTVPANFTGIPSNHTNCYSSPADNSGCAVIDASIASYGPDFDRLNGGVYVMKWDELSIAIWFFYRASIPADIIQGAPDPTGWGLPAAQLLPNDCDLASHFSDHQIVFDITTCGDWAGASFATSGCPGQCGETVQDPNNFINASWTINSLRVYNKISVTTASWAYTLRPNVLLATLVTTVTGMWMDLLF